MGYWQQDLYSLNSNFGTASDLKNLASALHARGMVSSGATEASYEEINIVHG